MTRGIPSSSVEKFPSCDGTFVGQKLYYASIFSLQTYFDVAWSKMTSEVERSLMNKRLSKIHEHTCVYIT